jgi:predicted ABC-type transport system involved in lysophospholipase L1 biosynthesis ATPase subunit
LENRSNLFAHKNLTYTQWIEQATEALVKVGLSDRLQNRPNQLRMRIVTHDANVAARTKRIIRMVDGVIVENAHDFLKLSL